MKPRSIQQKIERSVAKARKTVDAHDALIQRLVSLPPEAERQVIYRTLGAASSQSVLNPSTRLPDLFRILEKHLQTFETATP